MSNTIVLIPSVVGVILTTKPTTQQIVHDVENTSFPNSTKTLSEAKCELELEEGKCCIVCTMPFIQAHMRITMCNICNSRGNKTTVHKAARQVYATTIEAGIEEPNVG